MKLKKMIIENFRCFKDEQCIEFDTDGKITLILGHSGAGKTSLLQAVSWVFYNKFDSITDDKPIYNNDLFDNAKIDDNFIVKGSIEFIYLNSNYVLTRLYKYKKVDTFKAKILSKESKLIYQNPDKTWIDYSGDTDSKINEIIPQALSKYFFFHGEKGLTVDKSDDELKTAIYSLFLIDIYQDGAIHLGEISRKQSVLGKYNNQRLLTKNGDNDSIKIFREIESLSASIDTLKKYKENLVIKLEKTKERLSVLNSIIESAKNQENLKRIIKVNKELINSKRENINTYKKEFSTNLYAKAPYFLLSNKAKQIKNILNAHSLTQRSYYGMQKELLNDIIKQNLCLCNRHLDDSSNRAIHELLKTLPPNSFKYLLNEFSREAEKYENENLDYLSNLKDLVSEIIQHQITINKANEEITEAYQKLGKQSDLTEVINEYRNLERSKDDFIGQIRLNDEEISKKVREKIVKQRDYEKAISAEGISKEVEEKIEYVEKLKEVFKEIFDKKVNETRILLESRIKNIYEKLSTRIEHFDNKSFLDENFSLRSGYKTGGQEMIDVYSYVIGMVQAIKDNIKNNEMNGENIDREFPIIVDAPFSKTDDFQISHVMSVMPEIVSQPVFATFEERLTSLGEIKNLGRRWRLISNETQTISRIEEVI